ncbi:PAS domain-containing sensor histidine kinase [Pararoseomonas indoligenes]|uniref:histidine kinase n=1 Tax=Roseomonas indoligenes TaxID=2820811 RepID=A0A940S7Q7_9PROT|nr:ATP-binding protein [Pararoseomonas indoligenes]MBP0495175.1 PAS domain-containing protein [Pararoseomonas indoligenes]
MMQGSTAGPDVPAYGSAADLRAMADAVPALLSFFDADLICRYANAYHRQWYGRPPEEMVGLHMREFLGERGYVSRGPFLRRVLAGEEVSFDATVPHADGTWRDAAIRYRPRHGPQGLLGFHVLVFDTAVHQHRFHSLFDGKGIAFLELDLSRLAGTLEQLRAEGVERLAATIASDPGFVRRFVGLTHLADLNEKAASLFGLDREAAIGTVFGALCPPAAEPVLAANLLAYVGGERGFEEETVMLRADGQPLEVRLTSAFPQQGERQDRVFLGVIDIGARVRQDRRLAQLETDLAHAARVATLGELTASIAHEVNQPLAAVTANGDAALRWLRRPVPDLDEVEAAIRRVIEEGRRASEIIARTRALATKGTTKRALFDPNGMIEDAAALVRRQVASLGAELRLDLAPALPPVLADRVQLQQVVINLVVNAAQAMLQGPEGPRLVVVASGERAGTVVVEVSDTGPGIGEEAVPRLFEAFYTTKASGMGMGLSVSRTIVESHGGWIRAGGAPMGGAVFSFGIPVPEPARASGGPDGGGA